MGTKTAPTYANVFMGKFEEDFVYMYRKQPILWKRFIDDCFCIFVGSEDQLKDFIDYLNSCDPELQFTAEYSQTSVNFLDTRVFIEDNKIHTDLYNKPTDSHNYLLYDSAHPQKCKDSIPYSQYLRVRRICSKLSDYDKNMKTMTLHFIRRGYPLDLLQEAALKARRINRSSLLQTTHSDEKKLERTILSTTFHPNDNFLKK